MVIECNQFLHMRVRWRNKDPWLLIATYGNPRRVNCRLPQGHGVLLDTLMSFFTILRVVLAILAPTVIHLVSFLIQECGLIDMGGNRWLFTQKRGSLVQKLDRSLNLDWQL